MKWGIGLVILIIAGALYYFWTESHFDAKGDKKDATTRVEATQKAPQLKEPEKYIPPGSVMEDGTI